MNNGENLDEGFWLDLSTYTISILHIHNFNTAHTILVLAICSSGYIKSTWSWVQEDPRFLVAQ